jgi:hypothetical protein
MEFRAVWPNCIDLHQKITHRNQPSIAHLGDEFIGEVWETERTSIPGLCSSRIGGWSSDIRFTWKSIWALLRLLRS